MAHSLYRWLRSTFQAITYLAAWISFAGLASCTGLKLLPQDQILYTGAKIELEGTMKGSEARAVRMSLGHLLRPEPNKTFLGMRSRMWMHLAIRESVREKTLAHWLKFKYGKAPVLLDTAQIIRVGNSMENQLYHDGYFRSEVNHQVNRVKNSAAVNYTVIPGTIYTIDSVCYTESDHRLMPLISSFDMQSLLKSGEPYSLEKVKQERQRIDSRLKDLGYYFFSPDFLVYRLDSTVGDQKVKLYLHLKPDVAPASITPWLLRNITIHDDWQIDIYRPDTAMIGNIRYLSRFHNVRPSLLLDRLHLVPGEHYSRARHNQTLRDFRSLRLFHYINLSYQEIPGNNELLDASLFLSKQKKFSLSAELNSVIKSNNFAGPGMRFSITDRNLLKGAELLTFSLEGNFEVQLASPGASNFAYESIGSLGLSLPRIIPKGLFRRTDIFLPRSRFNLSYGVFSRVDLYRQNTFSGTFGYSWKPSAAILHDFTPFMVSYSELGQVSDDFLLFLESNPSVRRSFEEQFILGASYHITLDKLSAANTRRYLVSAGLEPSGLITGLIHEVLSTSERAVNLVGNPISQYIRLQTDNRYYFKTGYESLLATRLFIGAGIPIGSSKVMPYVRQFFSGGPNSLRGFGARSVGPGTYVPPDSLSNILVDQVGDIKLEINAEYRFPIGRIIKGAFFLEGGNVWLTFEDEARPGARFDFSSFYREFAISGGIGLRMDFDFLVLRFDWATPVRVPWLSGPDAWVIRNFEFGNREWRRQNMILNISIGYPF